MNNRVLITSVGRKVSLVIAFKEAGWYVKGLDNNPSSIALKYCDEEFTSTFYELESEIDLIIPTRDAELKAYTWKQYCNKSNVIEICQDKFKFYQWCKTNGFKTPEVYFVKPRISESGKEVECVWQELIEGEEYSVDLFADFQGNVISVVPRKRVKVLNGESVITQTVKWESLWLEAAKLSQSLGLVGHNCLQCFMVDGKLIWTDVNCRFGGASVVAIKSGCNSPLFLLKLINGEKIEPIIGKYKVGLIGKSYSEWDFEYGTSKTLD